MDDKVRVRAASHVEATPPPSLGPDQQFDVEEMQNYINQFLIDSEGTRVMAFVASIRPSVFKLLAGTNSMKLQALSLSEMLMHLLNTENSSILVPLLANILRSTLSEESSEVLAASAKLLGRLAQKNDGLIVETVDFQLKRALEWLGDETYGFRRVAAVLVLRELARNASSSVYHQSHTYFRAVWTTLCDPSHEVHIVAAEALQYMLDLMYERGEEGHFAKILKEAMSMLSEASAIHGCLRAFGELYRKRGQEEEGRVYELYSDKEEEESQIHALLLEHYAEVCRAVLKLLNQKKHHHAALKLLPRLCSFAPDSFTPFLSNSMKILLKKMRKGKDVALSLKILGEMLIAADENGSKQYLPVVANVTSTTLRFDKASASVNHLDAVACVGLMCVAGKNEMTPFLLGAGLLSKVFETGFSQALATSAEQIVTHCDMVEQKTIMWLLDMLCLIVCDSRFRPFGSPVDIELKRLPFYLRVKQQIAADTDDSLKLLALRTLRTFPFELQMVHMAEKLLRFLEAKQPELRIEGLHTCLALLERAGESAREKVRIAAVTHRVIERILLVAAADLDVKVRKLAVHMFSTKPMFDEYLARPKNIKIIILMAADEIFEVRCTITELLGRLAPLNPAYINPTMRDLLISQIKELEFVKAQPMKQMSASILTSTFLGSGVPPEIIVPYVDALLRIIRAQLQNSNDRLATMMLHMLANLCRVGGEALKPHLTELIPLLVGMFQDQAPVAKREAALRALRQLCQGTGHVVEPLKEHPSLLDALVEEIRTQTVPSFRSQVLETFGVLGALDPSSHKQQLQQTAAVAEKTDFSEVTFTGINLTADVYSQTGIHGLLRILEEASSPVLQKTALQALVTIFQSLGARKAVTHLPNTMPLLFAIIENAQDSVRKFAFQKLGAIVSQAGMHVRPFVDEMLTCILSFWDTKSFPSAIGLLSEIGRVFGEEFGAFLPRVFPHMIETLTSNHVDKSQLVVELVAHIAYNLCEYEYFVVPPIVNLVTDSPAASLRCASISAMTVLCQHVDCSKFTPRIVRAMLTVIESERPTERDLAIKALTVLSRNLGDSFRYFVPLVDNTLRKNGISAPEYNISVARALSKRLGTPVGLSMAETETSHGVAPEADSMVAVNIQNLKNAWNTSQLSTPQDWMQWHRRFSVMLLVESPSPVFRACQSVAQIHYPLARQLFNISFASCWKALSAQSRDALVQSLISALTAPTIPPEILQTLLDLAEYMELEDKLPIDKKTLGALSLRSQAFAKALRYTEEAYRDDPSANVEKMVNIYSKLSMPIAALGVLEHARIQCGVDIVDESWYENLERWEEALQLYESRIEREPESLGHVLGQVRCLHRLGEWEQVLRVTEQVWGPKLRKEDVFELAPRAAGAAYHTGQWQLMQIYVESVGPTSPDSEFYRAISSVFEGNYSAAQKHIKAAREVCDVELMALVNESYTRAYSSVVRLQQLVELEEVIDHLKSRATSSPEQLHRARTRLTEKWTDRLKGVQQKPFILMRLLGIRSVLLTDLEQHGAWLKYASICAKKGRMSTTLRIIKKLLGHDFRLNDRYLEFAVPQVSFGAIKYLWMAGKRERAVNNLTVLASRLANASGGDQYSTLLSQMHLKLARWRRSSVVGELDQEQLVRIADCCRQAVRYDDKKYKAWHLWSLTNFQLIKFYEKAYDGSNVNGFLVPTTRGFFRAIELSSGSEGFQDLLRLLTLWFSHGDHPEMEECLREGFKRLDIDTWIKVIPQLIARIDTPNSAVRRLVHSLLVDIGEKHPQAIVYPLVVATKSKTAARRTAASAIIARVKQHSPLLIEQATMVGRELISSSVILHERWFEGLEDAAGHYYNNDNIPAFLKRLEPLHAELQQCKFETRHQVSFLNEYGADLQEAFGLCEHYKVSKDINDLNEAWEGYARVYHKLKKKNPKLRKLQVAHVSPLLFRAKDLELAVPGTYQPGEEIIRISHFSNNMRIYNTKQRPRKLKIAGSDGNQYVFVLKAHEDLRQDERVMQFFSLTNSLLARAEKTKQLDIEVYPIIPLSPNSGLIGFVPHSDTLHQLITDYRSSRSIPLDVEFRYLYQRCDKGWPDYHLMTPLQKLEVYKYICKRSHGQELAKIMWIRAGSSEKWLETRQTFTNSLAVMSIVGYILGLGDRHPNNIVIDRNTGKLIHIDFGDCFESSIHRHKFPETVPFRLTRMLVACMEVAALHGTFVRICERVMTVLRENQDSISAIMEAFVFDPLFQMLVDEQAAKNAYTAERESRIYQGMSPSNPMAFSSSFSSEEEPGSFELATSGASRGARGESSSVTPATGTNDKAIQVIERIQQKLNGTDFDTAQPLNVQDQVARLLADATSEQNLSLLFHGWCSWW